jgi:hypothetical protein
MALARGPDCADAEVFVRFRLTGGEFDRAAGILLRYRDPGNCLLARVNATESDLRIFRCVQGVRRTLSGGRVEVSAGDGAWHGPGFREVGARLDAVVDGRASASSHDTCFSKGRIGLWTKSDSVTDFDDFSADHVK